MTSSTPSPFTPQQALTDDGVVRTDVLIIGSGPGGAGAAHGFIGSGLNVLVAERGGHIPNVAKDNIVTAMYVQKRYTNVEPWIDAATGKPFTPGTYYYVGGNTKFYGAALPRFRSEDFERVEMDEGVAQPWPFSYDELEPYYTRAEQLYRVRGQLGEDPTEPHHSEPFPFPAIEHEPEIERFSDALKRQGLHPYHSANGIHFANDVERLEEAGSDGTPSFADRKSDAWNSLLKPALEQDQQIQLVTGLRITRLLRSDTGDRLVAAEAELDGKQVTIIADRFVLGAGAVSSAALLLQSDIANSSGLVGRNYMVHNTTFLVGINPFRKNRTSWQKTIAVNDWYLRDGDRPPLGNMQMLGKLSADTLKGFFPFLPRFILKMVTDRSLDFCLISEDVADPENRAEVRDGKIFVHWKRNNYGAHRQLVKNVARVVRKAGYPFIFTRVMGIATNSHMCGTLVAGDTPETSVVDRDCRSHDLENLWAVDSSIFPSSTATNPVLTITANALRVVETIRASEAR